MALARLYESLVRPLLFRLSADRAHDLARWSLRLPTPMWTALGASARRQDPRLATRLGDLRLANPFGLAPGFDKNAEMLPALSQLGFGYLVVGSITREPRSGNPFPRLVRYPERWSIANSMGLPNRGLSAAVRALSRPRPASWPPIIASVAGFTSDELVDAAAAVEPHVAAVEIGLVCPNTTETERLEELRIFSALAEGLARRVRHKPLFIKMPPHHSEVDRERIFRMLDVCLRVGIQGVSLSGTRPVVEPGLGMGRGSLAGRDVYEDSLRIVQDVVGYSRGQLVVRAAGGVFTGGQALRMLEAGAASVEMYSAFIYRGWGVAGDLKRELPPALAGRDLGSVGKAPVVASDGAAARESLSGV
jgi:dihydroorotate dehydrogenase (fumarate)/dihydroorotate dehydrogenase